jgi:type VI secretion system protein ImpF
MAKPTRSPQLVPSVLDRLLGRSMVHRDDLGRPGAQRTANYSLRELEDDLLKDLGHLLNTRCPNVVWPTDLAELEGSLLAFGRPDFGIISLEDVKELPQRIQTVIETFEPRCESARVELISRPTTVDRTVELRVEMTLRADLAGERFVFMSRYETATGKFNLTAEPLE